jgi:redox-sensing transcriptional repressor
VAVICVPAEGAQRVVDELVACGVKSFWSFSNVSLCVPEGVFIQREVIAGGYAMLSVKLAQMKRK